MLKRLTFVAVVLAVALTPSLVKANSSSGYCVNISGPTFISVPPYACASASWVAYANLYTSVWNWSSSLGGYGSGNRYYATVCNFNPPPYDVYQSHYVYVFAQTVGGGLSDTDLHGVTVLFQSSELF